MSSDAGNHNRQKQWGVGLLVLAFVSFGLYNYYQAVFCDETIVGIPELGAEIGPFHLSDHQGHSVTHHSYGEKYLLVSFGYTFCPDICPTQLASFSDAMDLLGDTAGQVQPLLITLDPDRDNEEVLSHFVSAFHPKLIGLTGAEREIAKVASRLNVFYAKAGDESDPESYSVDHSTLGYLVDPHGKLLTVFPYGSTPEFVSERIKQNIRELESKT
ncbi:MAG: SCO family protein [Rhodospirillales bacterium]|nr:SCO family protein [Rhodospirillales bacterium]